MPFKPFTNEDVDRKLEGRNIKRLDDYKNIHLKIRWECMLCKFIWTVSADNILSKKGSCPFCNVDRKNDVNGRRRKLTNEDIDKRLSNRNIQRLDDYINSYTKINWKCLICDYKWLSKPAVVISSECGCPKCNTPGYNEKLMYSILSNNKIDYEMQYSIRSIDNTFPPYRFDAYLPERKIAIEYNGKQHYEATKFGSKYTEQDFAKQIARDQFIRYICKQHSITLIEIDGREFSGIRLQHHLEALIRDQLQ